MPNLPVVASNARTRLGRSLYEKTTSSKLCCLVHEVLGDGALKTPPFPSPFLTSGHTSMVYLWKVSVGLEE